MLQARGDSPDARLALSDLCGAYYAPVFAFISRAALNADAARDLTQEFFVRFLSRRPLENVEASKGRFRSYLLGAVKHFLADAHDHAHRLKRGAGVTLEPLDASPGTSPGLQVADASAPPPDLEFDRKWALTVLKRALCALAHQHEAAGKGREFAVLKPWLVGDTEHLIQGDAAKELGLSESAVRVKIHRLRLEFRQQVKREIAQTLNDPSETAHELACVIAVLRPG